jgi:membrane protein required for colicin V production
MSALDIIIIILVGVGTISGAVKGFIRDVFSLIAVVTGIIVALLLYDVAAAYLVPFIPEKTVARIVGFGVIFILSAAVVSIAGHFFSKSLSPDVSPYDRLAGACFGFVKGLVFAAVILFFLTLLVPAAATGSNLAPPIVRGTGLVIDRLPGGAKEKIDRVRDALGRIRIEATTPDGRNR